MKALCVFAGSNVGARVEYQAVAEELGRTLATRRISVVYGGGRIGLMGVLADAALKAGGRVIGVIPHALATKEVAHTGLSDLHVVASMHERKAMMADLSDGFIALPGGWGTLEEFFEVLTWAQLGLHQKPCGLLNVCGYFGGLLSFLDHAAEEGFVRTENRSMLLAASSVEEILDQLEHARIPVVRPWIDRAST